MPKPSDDKEDRIKRVSSLLLGLTKSQLGWLEEIAKQFNRPHKYESHPDSDIINDCMIRDIGDALRLHHCFSKQSFNKDKFEYLMERSGNLCGIKAELAPRGNPGHDLTINKQRFSLKTQADKGIKREYIYISKFMELGRGEWTNKGEDLRGLREQFFSHLRSYERIIVLRTLSKAPADWEYELVEIPKDLLLLARSGTLEMMHDSSQMPKPGYCYVLNDKEELLFELYFDGGSERKLQIKYIDIKNCIVHARWRFPSEELVAED